MAFRYRYADDANSTLPVKDFPLDATYALTCKAGDVVRLNGSGNLVLAATGDTTVAGILEGWNFAGLGVTPTTGKVLTSGQAVYEADFTGGTPAIGTSYGINGASTIDVADTTITIVKVVKKIGTKTYVRILPAALQL